MNIRMIQLIAVIIGIFYSVWVLAALLMYVPTGDTNELVVIDLSRDKIVNRIGELENAHGLAASPNSEYLVAGSMPALDPGKNRSATKPSAVSEAEHKAHHSGGSGAKPSNSPSFVAIVHPKHGHVMRRVAVRAYTHHLAVSPDGKIAVAVHSGAGGISLIDLGTMKVVSTVQTGLWPNYALFNRSGKRLYISNSKPGTVSEINAKNWKVVRVLKAGEGPEHMVLSPKDRKLYVANTVAGLVSVVDIVSGKKQQSYTVGKNVHGIDVSSDGRWLFAASTGANSLARVDLSNGKVTRIDLQPLPYHLAYIHGENKLYVSSQKLAKIWVLDPTSLAVVNEIDLGTGVAHQMVVRSAP